MSENETSVAVRPRVRTSTTTAAFDEAFAKAQAKFEAAVKSNTNPAFRSKYADVSSVIDATLEHLNSEGIGVKQHPGLEYKQVGDGLEAFMVVTTRLTFKGEWEESDLAIPAIQRDRFDAQSCGSALTYCCRYALQGIFVVRRQDDDANAASGIGSHEAAQAVGVEKVGKLKKAADSSIVASLFYAKQPSGLYAITGDTDLLRGLYHQLKKQWFQQDKCYMVNEETLEMVKFQCESSTPPIPFSVLKGPNA